MSSSYKHDDWTDHGYFGTFKIAETEEEKGFSSTIFDPPKIDK